MSFTYHPDDLYECINLHVKILNLVQRQESMEGTKKVFSSALGLVALLPGSNPQPSVLTLQQKKRRLSSAFL